MILKKRSKATNAFYKVLASALVTVMISLSLLPGTSGTRADQSQTQASAAILYFEQANPVVEKWVNTGTTREKLDLPKTLRAKIIESATDNVVNNNASAGQAAGDSAGLAGGGANGEADGGNAGTGLAGTDGEKHLTGAVETAADGNTSADGGAAGSAIAGENSGGSAITSPAMESAVTNGTTGNDLLVSANAEDKPGAGAQSGDGMSIGAVSEDRSKEINPAGNDPAGDKAPDNNSASGGPVGGNTSGSNPAGSNTSNNNAKSENAPVGNAPDNVSAAPINNSFDTAEYFLDVPVTWEGAYNGDVPGTYILKARAENYSYSGEMPTAIITVKASAGTGSISGFIWVDGNGDLDTDWDGLYNGDEWPLADVRVSLYDAGDLNSALAVAQTDSNGLYTFENLEPGSYVLGLIGDNIDGIKYLAPVSITSENKFAINWSVSGLPAFTEAINLDEGQTVDSINAGMRLPMRIQPRGFSEVTLDKLGNASVNDYVKISQYYYNIVRIKVMNGVRYYLLATKDQINFNNGTNSRFNESGTNPNYEGSELQARMTKYYSTDPWYALIKEIAVVPILGSHSSDSITSEPTARMAKAEGLTKDIMFAMSYKDYVDWNGGNASPLRSPLTSYTRIWSRTVAKKYNSYDIYGIINLPRAKYKGIDAGLAPNGYSDIGEVPAVWINGNAVNREIKVHYIDTDNKPIGPIVKKHNKIIGESFSLPAGEPQKIDGYEYIQWKKGASGTPLNGNPSSPALSSQEILDGKDIYLIYKRSATGIKVHYIDKVTGKELRDIQTVTADIGKPYTLHENYILPIEGYLFAKEWKEGSTSASVKVPPITVSNVTANMDIYLYYVYDAANIVISKEVTGELGDKTLPFTFIMYMFSPNGSLASDTEFTVKAGVIDGSGADAPSYTKLALENDQFIFELKHGQTIMIENIPTSYFISIIETVNSDNYDTTITDSENPSTIDGKVVVPTMLGASGGTRAFAFVNDRQNAVPTGFTDDRGVTAALPIIMALFIFAALAASEIFKRHIDKK